MNQKDTPVQINTGTSITQSTSAGVFIYITNALGNFTANGQATQLVSGQVLNFASPYLVTGAVTNCAPATIFYYYA